MGSTIIFLGILIFLAHLFNAIFSRRRIPDVLFLLTIGILIGPVLHFVRPEMFGTIGPVFASLTLLFILFDSGADISIDALQSSWKGFVQVTFFSFILSMGIVAVVGHVIGLEWNAGMLLGSMVAGTGASIVIPLVRQMRVSEYTATVLSLESALSAVLGIVVALAFIEGYEMGSMNVGSIVGTVFASILMSLLLGIVGGILWAGMLDRVRHLQNSMFLTPAFVFIIYGIAESLGYSGPIAALAFGIVLGNVDYFEFSFLKRLRKSHMRPLESSEKSFYKEIVFVLKTFFFVYIGVCMPFNNGRALLYGLFITLALFVVRFCLLAIVGRNNDPDDRLVVSMMIPKGLAAAVLASMPEQVNIAAGYSVIPHAEMIKYIAYSVIFFSIIITSLLVLVTRGRLVKTTLDTENKKDGETVFDEPSPSDSTDITVSVNDAVETGVADSPTEE
ncbi:MAG: cation:proton antiporter [Bacteroidales bacterium]|jgi:NhaP-type Na+/H+ or K+/H+ antiporter|nr:cation:proton antiporter [Bacteroidales bacterium]